MCSHWFILCFKNFKINFQGSSQNKKDGGVWQSSVVLTWGAKGLLANKTIR